MMQSAESYRQSIVGFSDEQLEREEKALENRINQLNTISRDELKNQYSPSSKVVKEMEKEYLFELQKEIMLRQHGTISTESFDIRFTESYVIATSEYSIPFEISKSNEGKSKIVSLFKSRLRTAIQMMLANEQSILDAQYAEINNKRFYDLENVLIYNLGTSTFKHLCLYGIRFSDMDNPLDFCSEHNIKTHKHIYYYRRTDVRENISSKFDLSLPIVKWDSAEFDVHEKNSPFKYWKAMQNAKLHNSKSYDSVDSFALMIGLYLPKNMNVINLIKPLIDGVVSAFHGKNEMMHRTYAEFCQKHNYLETRQNSEWVFPLGNREYIRKKGDSFIWNPADDKLRAAVIRVHYGDARAHFDGFLCHSFDAQK